MHRRSRQRCLLAAPPRFAPLFAASLSLSNALSQFLFCFLGHVSTQPPPKISLCFPPPPMSLWRDQKQRHIKF